MTGDDCLRVLDLDMELGEHAAGIMQEHGKAWLKGRLMYYGEKSDALFKAAGEVLAEAPDRASQLMAETLLRQVEKDLYDMEISSETYEQVTAVYDEMSDQDCWLGSKAFISLYLQDMQKIWAWCVNEPLCIAFGTSVSSPA